MSHWSLKYMRAGYKLGADGPEDYDCWNFVRWIWRDHYGIDMPALPTPGDMTEQLRLFATNVSELGWKQVAEPKNGDGVLFVRAKAGIHVGIYIGDLSPPRVLHNDDGGPKLHMFSHLESLRWSWRFYRYGV